MLIPSIPLLADPYMLAYPDADYPDADPYGK